MKISRAKNVIAVVAGLLGATTAASAVNADEVADFYKNKTVTIWSGLSPGGSYTAYALILKDYMPKYIPGNPTIIVGSRTGGSGRVLANWMAKVGPRDGSMFGLIHERMGLEPHVYPKGTRFDGRELTWIGSMAKQKSVCYTWHKSKVKTFEDAQKMTAIVGTSSSTATGSVMPRMLNSMAGTKFKIALLHGDMPQNERVRSLAQVRALICLMPRSASVTRCDLPFRGNLGASRPAGCNFSNVFGGTSSSPEVPSI